MIRAPGPGEANSASCGPIRLLYRLGLWLGRETLRGKLPLLVCMAPILAMAESFQDDCLGKLPAGTALQRHLAATGTGSVDAAFCSGAIYLYVRKDVDRAIPLLEKAAVGGDQRAPLVLGILYEKGTGVRKDPKTAARWYQRGVDNGQPAAARRLSELYRLGLGVEHDEAKATQLMRLAASLGDKAAPRYERARDQERATPAIGQDIKDAAYRAYAAQRYDESVQGYLRCAEMGNAQCELAVGVHYEFGYGVPRDDTKAAAWYRKAADQGDAIAQKALGMMYESGRGVSEDWTAAAQLYRTSGDRYADGAYALGRMYQFGMGVPQNRAIAIEWFEKAAKLGNSDAANWAKWLSDYTNCIGFRNDNEQRTLGFLRCPADPVGATFQGDGQRLAYLREKGREFDRAESEALALRAQRARKTDEQSCNLVLGHWTKSQNGGGFCQ